mmetsp:Transcript_24502/g.27912  ORF Transcript_24502/g.27912 Transcript_24502/m.27912 type:complete len:204 (+) Transcript_24502:1-612(+)
MAAGYTKSNLKSNKKELPATGYLHMSRDTKRAGKILKLFQQLLADSVPTKQWVIKSHPFTPEVCASRIPELGDKRCETILKHIQKKHKGLLDKDYTVLEPYSKGGKWEKAFHELKLDESKLDSISDLVDTKKKKIPKKLKKIKKKGAGKVSDTAFSKHSWVWAALVEEIAVSYGKHEMTSEKIKTVLDFLMKNAGLEKYNEVN